MKTIAKNVILLISLIGGCLVFIVSMAYVFTDFSKSEFIKFLQQIPDKNFGYIMISIAIMSFIVFGWLTHKLLTGVSKKSQDIVNLADLINSYQKNLKNKSNLHIE